MKKLLKPGDVLLLGLAGGMDVFETIKDPFGLMASGSKALYGWVPERYRKHNFSRLVTRQLQTGNLEKVVKGDEVYLRLTSEGKEKVIRDFPMLRIAQERWDRRWRLVIFDISEINRRVRSSLRRKLKELGFGMLQESVWITPHDVTVDMREFLEYHDLGSVAFVLEVSHVLAGDIDALVRTIWHLDDLASEYSNILNEATKLLSVYVAGAGRHTQHTSVHGQGNGRKKIGKQNVEKKVREIRERYMSAFLSDPCLPAELLPTDWPGKKAREAVEGLNEFIAG